MIELLNDLPPGAVVLDIGCDTGSFEFSKNSITVVKVDLELRSGSPASNFVQANAAWLPFGERCFDMVVANHSLEHFENLDVCLAEIHRVIKPNGALYIAVPDANTVSDRLYRWLARGGGHINAFLSADELGKRVARATGLQHVGTRTLCTSLSFLNRRNRRTRAPRRLLALGGGAPFSLLLFTYIFRLVDRLIGTRLSVYGWALYFGNLRAQVAQEVWTNVCIGCGTGYSCRWLLAHQIVVKTVLSPAWYRCPECGSLNLFTNDKQFTHLISPNPLRH